MTSVSAPVTRTAKDALQAKFSALQAGYVPAPRRPEEYAHLLETLATSVSATRRQTPLVHAGYAMRVASVLHKIDSFVRYHTDLSGIASSETNTCVQIVILGAGLDVTGLWSTSLEPSVAVHVVEVDCAEIVKVKREVLVASDLVRPEEKQLQHGQHHLAARMHPINATNDKSTIALVSADLNQVENLQTILKGWVDREIPTLILSELVLAYLSVIARDDLLGYCARLTATNDKSGSCLVVYEPLGDVHLLRESIVGNDVSVVQGYQRSYHEHFVAKLERGKSKDGIECKNSSFHPLGSSCRRVEELFRASGFDDSLAASAGKASAVARRQASGGANLSCPEIFDEHTALGLHLQSYVVACGFPSGTSPVFKAYLCGGGSGLVRPRGFRLASGARAWMTRIDTKDESQVRVLFSRTYQHLFDEYPAIRKMVKTALKKDLRSDPCSADKESSSSIGNYYFNQGGDFVVIVEDTGDNMGKGALEHERRVLAGMGLRQCTAQECISRNWSLTSYEIHRLFVDVDSRQAGLASTLLEAAIDMVSKPCQLIATTPTIVESANAFYKAKGFHMHDEALMGDLLMRSYVKRV